MTHSAFFFLFFFTVGGLIDSNLVHPQSFFGRFFINPNRLFIFCDENSLGKKTNTENEVETRHVAVTVSTELAIYVIVLLF